VGTTTSVRGENATITGNAITGFNVTRNSFQERTSTEVSCGEREVAIGGGLRLNEIGRGLAVAESVPTGPTSAPTGWRVEVVQTNFGNSSGPIGWSAVTELPPTPGIIQAYVICTPVPVAVVTEEVPSGRSEEIGTTEGSTGIP
jgi:hypothetical protein